MEECYVVKSPKHVGPCRARLNIENKYYLQAEITKVTVWIVGNGLILINKIIRKQIF